MRCSLLALSSYIDTELDLEPAGELEAHLVACERCRTAIGHLREESARIGALARVHVPDDAVRDLFSQIGLIAEEDDLPEGPVRRDRPAAVEAPPWFGAERGAALPWAPRPTGHDQSQPRELIGERSPTLAVAEPPELYLWDETIDQIATAVPAPPPVRIAVAPAPAPTPEPLPVAHLETEQPRAEPEPPEIIPTEPQPPDLSTSAPIVAAPRLAAGPNAFQRLRDAVAVRLALRRGASSSFDHGVEIVSGTGAPTWNQRARRQHRSESPPIMEAAVAPVAEPPSPSPTPPPVVRTSRLGRLMGRVTTGPAAGKPMLDAEPNDAGAPEAHPPSEGTAPLELAEVLSEVAILAAPLERTATPAADPPATAPAFSTRTPTVTPTFDHVNDDAAPAIAHRIDPRDPEDDVVRFGMDATPDSAPAPGRHVRRLHSQKTDRREWNPTRPVTGRHVLPLGGPAVGAADRDQRLWLFSAVTVVLILLGLVIGRQVTQTGPLVASTIPRSTPNVRATAPASIATLPVATAAPVPTALIPIAPTPQQLTGAKTLGSGSGGFSVADVRYGLHPNDFRLVFDLAFPSTVTGSPTTVIGYSGPTTIDVEFTGVVGVSNVAAMPPGKVVVSVVPLPMARNTDRLVFKITLSKNAPFDAYYLSGGRLVIDIT
ncbi:MAG: zf-HC2 domain-containing protein [Candidatus Dormibacteria bacterium]